ncbi:MAG TPA: hypothetical protein VKU37_05345 [Verrucomicrobiae bacterium]|nr:hypothetical protein [Verrucomicrobiae bacterium]
MNRGLCKYFHSIQAEYSLRATDTIATLKNMIFFAESAKELDSGVIGFELRLWARDLPLSHEMRELAAPFKCDCTGKGTGFEFGGISKKGFPFGLHFVCHCHIEGDKLEYFVLSLGRKPKSEPPPELLRTSNELGGYPTAFLKLISAMKEQEIQCRAFLSTLVSDTKRWPIKIKPQKLPKKIGGFTFSENEIDFETNREETKVAMRFQPGPGFILDIRSNVNVKLDKTCFETASEQLWDKARPLFGKK